MLKGVSQPNPNSVTGTLTVSSTIQSTGGNIVATGVVINRSGSSMAAILDDGAGYIRLFNGTLTDFTGVKFGGSTDANPAIFRDGAGFKFVGAAGGSTSWIKVPGVTVASLPAAATAGAGARSFVTDALSALSSATVGTTVTGGGSNKSPFSSDGSNWLYG